MTLSDSLKKLVNSKATTMMQSELGSMQNLFDTEIETVRDAMNAVLIVNSLRGDTKSYQLVAQMLHEDAPPPPTTNNNLFILPSEIEKASIAQILKTDKNEKVSIDSIGDPNNG